MSSRYPIPSLLPSTGAHPAGSTETPQPTRCRALTSLVYGGAATAGAPEPRQIRSIAGTCDALGRTCPNSDWRARIALLCRGITGRLATGTLRRPVDIPSRSENHDCATAPNGVLRATTDRKYTPNVAVTYSDRPRVALSWVATAVFVCNGAGRPIDQVRGGRRARAPQEGGGPRRQSRRCCAGCDTRRVPSDPAPRCLCENSAVQQ